MTLSTPKSADALRGRTARCRRGRPEPGGRAIVAVDPFADVQRNVESGGVDEGPLGQVQAESLVGGGGERGGMLGEHAVEIDGDAWRLELTTWAMIPSGKARVRTGSRRSSAAGRGVGRNEGDGQRSRRWTRRRPRCRVVAALR